MNEENNIALSVAILEEAIQKLKIKRNKAFSPTDYEYHNNKIMAFVEAIIELRTYLNPDLDA